MDTIDILAITIICINFMLFLPICIICTLRISKHCKEPHFQKRYPYLLYYIVIFALLYICVDRTFYILINILSFINIEIKLKIVEIILSTLTILICLSFFLERTWMLYYDHNYHLGRSDVWRRNVGSITERNNDNWFDRRKSTFGNTTYLRKLMICLYIFLLIVIFLILYFVTNIIIREIIFCVFLAIFLCCIIYSIYGIQSEWDFVSIRIELSWDLIIILFSMMVYIITTFIFKERTLKLLKCLIFILSVYGLIFMSIGFPLISWSSQNKRNRRISRVMPNRQSKILPLTEILKNSQAFELFMLHLVKEFAVENLLFICELMQFKQHLQIGIIKPTLSELSETEFTQSLISSSNLFIMELPMDIIPISRLIKHSKSNLSAARGIYNKYIYNQYNSLQFEINISSRTRAELHEFFNLMYPNDPPSLAYHSNVDSITMTVSLQNELNDKMTKNTLIKLNSNSCVVDETYNYDTKEKEINSQNSMMFDGPSELDLFSVFDHAKDEIIKNLKDSYRRFASSKEYQQVEPIILKIHHRKNLSQSFKKQMISSAKLLMKQVSRTKDTLKLGIELNNNSTHNTDMDDDDDDDDDDYPIVDVQQQEQTNFNPLNPDHKYLRSVKLST